MTCSVPKSISAAIGRIAILAALFLVAQPAPLLRAQTPAPPPHRLQIVILDGEGALNNIQERTAREPIVQVQDENHKPVAGAAVLFALHPGTAGAGGAFANGATSLSVTTDVNGVARLQGMLANHIQGSWQIQVTATLGGLTATTVITEMNIVPPAPPTTSSPTSSVSTPPPHSFFHWIFSKPVMLTGGIIAAGTVVAVVVVKQNSTGSTTITPGSPTVGPPAVRTGIRIRF